MGVGPRHHRLRPERLPLREIAPAHLGGDDPLEIQLHPEPVHQRDTAAGAKHVHRAAVEPAVDLDGVTRAGTGDHDRVRGGALGAARGDHHDAPAAHADLPTLAGGHDGEPGTGGVADHEGRAAADGGAGDADREADPDRGLELDVRRRLDPRIRLRRGSCGTGLRRGRRARRCGRRAAPQHQICNGGQPGGERPPSRGSCQTGARPRNPALAGAT